MSGTSEKARNLSRNYVALAEAFRAIGMDDMARHAEQRAEAWGTGTRPAEEPELAALLASRTR